MIAALATFADATGDKTALADAVRAADWVNAHLAGGDGGYRHGSTPGTYLGDTLAMANAQLALYRATRRPPGAAARSPRTQRSASR